jgi:hypothetical protein
MIACWNRSQTSAHLVQQTGNFFSIYFVLQTYFLTNFLSSAVKTRGLNSSGAREFFPRADPRSYIVNTGIKRSGREIHPPSTSKSEASHTWSYKAKRKVSLCEPLRHLCVARLIIILGIRWGEWSVSSSVLFTCLTVELNSCRHGIALN